MAVCRYLWTWHLSAYHFSQLGIQLISMVIHFHESCHSFESFKLLHCPLSYCVFVWSIHATKSFVVLPDVQRKVEEVYLYSQNSLCVSTFESVLWLPHSHHSRTLFRVSCRRCGIHHGPPLTRLFRSTLAHHPRNSLRNNFSTLRFVCFNEIFSRSWHRFTSSTFDRKIPLGVWHQDIYSRSVDCTRVRWESFVRIINA